MSLDDPRAWDDAAKWLKLGDELSALAKIADHRAFLLEQMEEIRREHSRLAREIPALEAQKSALGEQSAALAAEVAYWEEKLPNLGVTVGIGTLTATDTTWVDRVPRLRRWTRQPGSKPGTRLVLPAPAYTYALFKQDALIYIGFTENWRSRHHSHAGKGYDEFVLQGWPTEADARRAEEYAIHDRHPPLNREADGCHCKDHAA